MTEPIAVDVPGKPAFARSVPGPLPASAPLPVPGPLAASAPAAAPRVDAPPKPPAASTPAPAAHKAPAATTTPTPVTPAPLLPKTMTDLLSRLTKKQLTIGVSAVLSLVAGIGLVRLMFPAKEEPKATQTASKSADQPVLSRNAPPTAPSTLTAPETKGPSLEVTHTGADLPPPAMPALPLPPGGAPTAKPNGISPLPPVPPVVFPEKPSYPVSPAAPTYPPPAAYGDTAKPPPRVELPPLPGGSNLVIPVAGADAPKPPVGTVGPPPALPPIPAMPPAPGMNTPGGGAFVPVGPSTPPAPPGVHVPAGPPGTAPVAPGGMAPVIPPPTDLTPGGPAVPAIPAKPDMGVPTIPGGHTPPTAPVMPPSPAPGMVVVPPPSNITPPVMPAIPAPPTGLPSTPVAPPAGLPEHKNDPKSAGTPGAFPSTVDVTPKPDFKPPAGVGTPANYTKPGGSAEVKPNVPEATPQTSFDVDLHDPKLNDSYESISQEFYNDRRYAAALKAFNRNQPLTGGKQVEVPPIHILKKRYPSLLGNVAASGSGGTPSSAPQWASVGDKSDPVPARAAGAYRNTYVIPAGSGMSLKGVAKLVYGSEQRWTDLYNLNSYRPEDLLPPGTEVRLPADVRPPR